MQLTQVKLEKKPANTRSRNYPDLPDSVKSLPTLKPNFGHTHKETSDHKINQHLQNTTIKEESSSAERCVMVSRIVQTQTAISPNIVNVLQEEDHSVLLMREQEQIYK